MKSETALIRESLAEALPAPGLIAMLREDVACVFQRDPAARSTLELLTIYPGIQALVAHRFAHALWKKGLRYLPRLLSFISRMMTNIDIHPGATIGRRFFIDHGACVVIGETAVIGEDVTLYHGVTLGGTTWRAGKRHPTLGDGVVVGAGAKILGAITLGNRVRVAANSVVIDDVQDGVTVVGIPGRAVTPREQRRVAPGGIDLDHHQIPDPVGKAIACLLERIGDLEREVQRLKGDPLPDQGVCRDCDDTCSQPAFEGSLKAPKQGVRHG